jgi:phenylalanyl-tRNA synthetase beta chain
MQTIKKSDMLDVIVPIRRSPQDCTYDQDLYEEIVRIYGYEKIPTAPLSQQAKYVAYSPLPLMTRKIEEIIIHQLRYHQVETYPRVHEEALKNFGIDTNHLLTLQNSLAPELTHLRDSMYYNMIDYIQKNKPFFDEMSLYDTGNTRQRDGENHHEIPIASGAIYHKEPKNRQQDPFLKAKGDIDFLIKTITTHKPTYKSDTKYGFHPKKYTTVWLDDVYLGRVGEIHPQQAQYYKIELPSRVVVYELQINALIDCYKKNNDQAST